jgi:UDP-glucose 4-epimerase
MRSSVLVTGGAGYIGSVTVERLIEAGRRVVVLDDLSRGHRDAVSAGVPLVVGDIGDAGLVLDALRRHEVDAVVHFAAASLIAESMREPALYYENNVVRGVRLLDAMLAAGVRKIVFSSSAGVYGDPESSPIEESHATRPVNVYGETKLAFERILSRRAAVGDLAQISLRYFNAAGASRSHGEDHRPETHLVPLALRTVQGRIASLEVFGDDYDTPDGTCIRDYVDVRDLADAHILALDALDRGRSRAYNLGNGDGASVLSVIEAVSRVTGKEVPWKRAPRREGDPARLVASASLARRELGWTPRHPDLDDIVASAWEWAKRFPDGYPDEETPGRAGRPRAGLAS